MKNRSKSSRCATFAELLKQSGYTFLTARIGPG